MVARRETLKANLRAQRPTDAEMRALLKDAARSAERTVRMARVPSNMRQAQLLLAQQQIELWADLDPAIRRGVHRAGRQAIDVAYLWEKELIRSSGLTLGEWQASLRATAAQGIESYMARRHHHYTLSERVFRNRAFSANLLNRTIDSGLLLGKSAREIAKDVSYLIRPDVPGGVSYAAFRLGRTELNNAFHETSITKFDETPWTQAIQWNLSGSHPKSDVCDDYANGTHFRGGEPGQFKTDECPDKPHPQCFCYTTPVNVSDEEFLRAYRAGQYDGYINSVMQKGIRAA